MENSKRISHASSGDQGRHQLSSDGAAIGEWLGAQSGLGYFSRRMMTQLDGAGVFAPILLLSVVAMAFVGVVSALEKRMIRWRND